MAGPDFAVVEYEQRCERAQALMAERDFDALLFCTEAEVRYFSGFRTLFWHSPTRPWFLVLKRTGKPVAIIPEIGADLMAKTWIGDIRTWPAPRRDDDGIGLLVAVLAGCRKIGLPMGEEASLRMPLSDFFRLREEVGGTFVDCTGLVRTLRMTKSPAEIAAIRAICTAAGVAFDRAPQLFREGQPLDDVFRSFRIALLEAGAEDVPYLVGGAGQGGYGDVISPPDETPLKKGDVLMLDTGATLKGYFCDFDRNFAIGHAGDDARRAYALLWKATEAGLEMARHGVTAADVFRAMHEATGSGRSDIGRFGHGLGMQLTEWPSLMANDDTVLEEGMVITLEPSLVIGEGRMMVHEENVLITRDMPELLTRRAPPELPVI